MYIHIYVCRCVYIIYLHILYIHTYMFNYINIKQSHRRQCRWLRGRRRVFSYHRQAAPKNRNSYQVSNGYVYM